MPKGGESAQVIDPIAGGQPRGQARHATFQIPVRTNWVALSSPPLPGPPFPVPEGAIVEVSPSGKISGAANSSQVFVSTNGPEAARQGPRLSLQPADNARVVSVRVLSDIWVFAIGDGDGVLITVR